jgi:hypothetical protein
MILFQNIVEILHGAVLAIMAQIACGLELSNGWWVSGVLVGIDDARHRMVLPSQRFDQEAHCCGRVLLGREEKVEGRAGRIHRK